MFLKKGECIYACTFTFSHENVQLLKHYGYNRDKKLLVKNPTLTVLGVTLLLNQHNTDAVF